jgi:hypothetical protein
LSAILGYGWSGSDYTDINVVPISALAMKKVYVTQSISME